MSDASDRFVETPVPPPEWDVGVFTVWDNGSLVALLWVTNGGNPLAATEYWGLGPSWVWPSSTNTSKTFQFKYTTAYSISSTGDFKNACDTEFGSGNTTYQKHTTVTF
jgi:hypothetical protein